MRIDLKWRGVQVEKGSIPSVGKGWDLSTVKAFVSKLLVHGRGLGHKGLDQQSMVGGLDVGHTPSKSQLTKEPFAEGVDPFTGMEELCIRH
jgi:hypothetical protein